MYEFLKGISDGVGLFGVSLILIAYYLITVGKVTATSMGYQLLNFIGAGLLLFSLFFNWNLASVIIQIAWMAISLVGMVKARKKTT